MVPVKQLIERNICGSFLLQPHICLAHPSSLIPETFDANGGGEKEI